MHDLQKTIDGRYVPMSTYSASQLLAGVPSGLQSASQARCAWLASPVVHAFCRNACVISELDEMEHAYREHLDQMQSFERFARCTREVKAGERPEPTPAQKAASAQPGWYRDYLATEHWRKLREQARAYYAGCVLCGTDEAPECHHRHYRTLGREQITDLSILCSAHHAEASAMLRISPPRICPEPVRRLLGL